MIAHLNYLLCDNQDGYACPLGPDADDAREARQLATRAGWTRRNGKDFCPNCSRTSEDTRTGVSAEGDGQR